MIRSLLDVKIVAKCGNCRSQFFSTDTGAPPGVCASDLPNWITWTAIANDTPSLEQHNNIQSNYHIVPPNYQIDVDQQYADNTSKISTSISAIYKFKDHLPVKLAQRGLKVNESKTEECTIKRTNCDNRWRDCKLLGSLLDTQNDIKRRKVLVMNTASKLKHLFLNKNVTVNVKAKLLKSYITPIWIMELWTLAD